MIKRLWWIVVGLVLTISFGLAPANFKSRPVAAQEKVDPAAITVYVTRTGKLYHRDGCRYLRQSRIPMSLKDAAKRYGSCSVCKPPTL